MAKKVDDPVMFAEDLSSVLATSIDCFLNYAPTQRQAFLDILGTLRDQVPAETLTRIEEAAESWGDACHGAGVRLGVASEDLRKGALRD